jgi:hypothetical protein
MTDNEDQIDAGVQEEGRQMMEEVQVDGEAMGADEVIEHGHLVALDMIIQCDGCLRRGEETPLRVTLVGDDAGTVAEKLVDLVLVCDKCTAVEQADHPNALVAIPVDVLVGSEVQYDDVETDGLPATDGDEQPFAGDVTTTDIPGKIE